MFGVITVMLFTYYLYRLFQPIDTKKYLLLLKDIHEYNKNKAEFEAKLEKMSLEELINYRDGFITQTAVVVSIIIQQIAEFVYLAFALGRDPLKIPTIAMLLWWIIVIVKPNKGKDVDEALKIVSTTKYKTRRKIIAIIDLIYFGYMFILYLFVI